LHGQGTAAVKLSSPGRQGLLLSTRGDVFVKQAKPGVAEFL